MKISTKGRYGLRALIDLAEYGRPNAPVFLSDIAKRQSVSEKYLEHIFSALLKSGLVKAYRGRKGGYLLNKDPESITLNEVISILEGPCSLVDCVSDEKACPKTGTCVTRDVWKTLGNKIEEVLNGYTVASLLQMQKEKTQKDSLMYYI
jgi:Rrf2 family transcriptional regulator, cysteine metabolism repressor